jgi:hypothetical protein
MRDEPIRRKLAPISPSTGSPSAGFASLPVTDEQALLNYLRSLSASQTETSRCRIERQRLVPGRVGGWRGNATTTPPSTKGRFGIVFDQKLDAP